MTQEKYGIISFADALAGQEPAIKLGALSRLHEYFREANLSVPGKAFWEHVQAFQEETDGLHVSTCQAILQVALTGRHKEYIERIGFQVAPVTAGTYEF